MKKNRVFKGETREEAMVNVSVDKMIQAITFRKIKGAELKPWNTASQMFKLFEEIVSNTQWKDADELKRNLIEVCQQLIKCDKMNFVVRNCSERMLKIFK